MFVTATTAWIASLALGSSLDYEDVIVSALSFSNSVYFDVEFLLKLWVRRMVKPCFKV